MTSSGSTRADSNLESQTAAPSPCARGESAEILSSAVEQSGINIVITDARGIIKYVTPAFEELTGYSRSELIGKTPALMKSGTHSEEFYRDLWEKIRAGNVWRGQFHNRRKDGELFWALATISPVRDDGGKIRQFIAVHEEVTQIKATEERLQIALEEAERASQAKSEFLANMSHEIRTPMNGVIGMTHLLLDCELGTEQREYVEVMHKSADALLKIINDILDFSKIESGQLHLEETEFCLGTVLQDCTRLMAPRAQEKGLEFIHDVDPAIPGVLHGDPSRLRQVLLNLIGNAVKFTPQGEIVIRLSVREKLSQTLEIDFQVHDTGIGIPEEQLSHIFEKYVQAGADTSRNHGGTGLGLAISKALVEAMGGSIRVESTPGEGSTFSFCIPFKKWSDVPLSVDCRETFHANSIASLCPHKGEILLVEDNPTSQQVAARLLQRMGHRIQVASSGEEALALLADNSVDLVLMDLRMPGINGLETTRRLRAPDAKIKNPHVPIVAMTAHAMAGDRQHCLDAGMNDYIAKPIVPDQLAEAINHWLHPDRPRGGEHRQHDSPHRDGDGDVFPASTILVVDDDPITRQVLGKLLHSLGYKADYASTASEAIEIHSPGKYSAILMDWAMPEVDGLVAVRKIRETEKEFHTPIIMVSAAFIIGDEREFLSAGVDELLPKPVSKQELARKLCHIKKRFHEQICG